MDNEQRSRRARRVALPGGAGLVGQNLVAHLRGLGYQDLVVIDKHEANAAILRQVQPGVEVIVADVAEPGPWQDVIAGADAVVMLQAQIGDKHPEPFVRNNVTATERVLDACRRGPTPPYLVHISSSVVRSVADDDYTRTKARQEALVLASGLDCVVLRPTLMFGWFDRKHLGWLARFMRRVPVFPVPGDGRYMRQPLYVGDFCAIIADCLERRPAGQIHDISGLERVDYIDLIRHIRTATGARTPIVRIPVPLFRLMLRTWAVFDANPPFTASQLDALIAHDEFDVIDWPGLFGVTPTPLAEAIDRTFNDPRYGGVVLAF